MDRYWQAFPEDDEHFPDEHKVLMLARSPENIEAFSSRETPPRVALIPMADYGDDVQWFSEIVADVTNHALLPGHEDDVPDMCGGAWLDSALAWLKLDL